MRPISEFSNSANPIAICVGREDEKLTHCGFLYTVGDSVEEQKNYFLHLTGPLELKNELAVSPSGGYLKKYGHYKWNPFLFDEEHQALLVSKCILISKRNSRLPYSIIHDENTTFDAQGVLKLGESSGVTCSSFVKTVLKSQNINIIDDSDWPEERESDEEWAVHLNKCYAIIIEGFKKEIDKVKEEIRRSGDEMFKNHVGPSKERDLIEKRKVFMETQKGIQEDMNSCFKRYRPEEIAAAAYAYSTVEDNPLKFQYPNNEKKGVEEMGKEILAQLPPAPKGT